MQSGVNTADRSIGTIQLDPQSMASEHLLVADLLETIVIDGASVVLQVDQALVLIDPVGDQQQYRRFGRPDIVVLASTDADHLSIETMIGLLRRDTLVLAQQSIIDQLPLMIANNLVTPFDIGTNQTDRGISFKALSPFADPPRDAQVYNRERGDIGVLISVSGHCMYF